MIHCNRVGHLPGTCSCNYPQHVNLNFRGFGENTLKQQKNMQTLINNI